MRKRILLLSILVLVLILGSSAYLLLQGRLGSGGNGGITDAWLSQELSAWRPAQNGTVGFALFDSRSSYGMPASSTLEVQEADLNMLLAAGPSCIRIDIGYGPWLSGNSTTIGGIDTIVSLVRAAGKCLIIADASSESYRGLGNQLPWDQFKAAWVQRVQTLAQRYHPDYYIVIKEPGWYAPMVSDARTNPLFRDPNDWLSLTKQLAGAVLSVSPQTKVGISVDAGGSMTNQKSYYDAYLQGCEAIPSISFIGFDIYSVAGFSNTQNFLSAFGSGGKSIWIAEAWSGTGGAGTANTVYDPSRSQLDVRWMLALYYFALQIHASVVAPFFTNIFASYTWSSDPQDLVNTYSQRTPVFYEFQDLSTKYGARL